MCCLWITRINTTTRSHTISYNRLMHGLKEKNIRLDRKMLSGLAVSAPKVFEHIVKMVH